MEITSDLGGQPLDLPLVSAGIVEAGQDMLIMQAFEVCRFPCDAGEQLVHLVAYVGPARREEVHLYYGIVGVLRGRGEENASIIIDEGGVRVREPWTLCWVVAVGLPVGDVAARGVGVSESLFAACEVVEYRFVRSRHMAASAEVIAAALES